MDVRAVLVVEDVSLVVAEVGAVVVVVDNAVAVGGGVPEVVVVGVVDVVVVGVVVRAMPERMCVPEARFPGASIAAPGAGEAVETVGAAFAAGRKNDCS